MSGPIGDDDPTPAAPPIRPENLPLLAVLYDLILATHDHARRLRLIAAEVRNGRSVVSPELKRELADEVESFHTHAAAQAARIREAA